MAHFAELNSNNEVIRVIVTKNDDLAWVTNTYGGHWLQTSYNAATNGFRKTFAVPGGTYDEAKDAFLPAKPFESWILDESTYTWIPPVELPEKEGFYYLWNESTKSWDEVEEPEN